MSGSYPIKSANSLNKEKYILENFYQFAAFDISDYTFQKNQLRFILANYPNSSPYKNDSSKYIQLVVGKQIPVQFNLPVIDGALADANYFV